AGRLSPTLIERDLRDLLAAWTIGDSLLALAELAKREPAARRAVALVRGRGGRADFARLVRTSDAAARVLLRRVTEVDSDDGRALLRGAVLLRTIAETAAAHEGFLRGHQD
ncbi:unnamed protein product, partial [marine sediment metagenome]